MRSAVTLTTFILFDNPCDLVGRGDWTIAEQRDAGLDAVDQLGAYFAKVAEANSKL